MYGESLCHDETRKGFDEIIAKPTIKHVVQTAHERWVNRAIELSALS